MNMYDFGARNYDPALGRWMNIDPLAEKFVNVGGYTYVANNPVNFKDPDGRDIRLGNLMGSDKHALAFMIFAMTNEGKAFLDNYASENQKFSYQGVVFYESKKAGKYHNENINLNFSINKEERSSSTSTELVDNGLNINVNIGSKGFGLQPNKQNGLVDPIKNIENNNKTVFNLLSALTHENFLHVDSKAQDFSDDRIMNKSNLPEQYRNSGNHADHFYFSHQTLNNPHSNSAKIFDGRGFSVLKRGNDALRLNLPNSTIKTMMWNFDGSRIKVNPTNGSYIYDKYGSSSQ